MQVPSPACESPDFPEQINELSFPAEHQVELS
jgi:hypothetical protein